MTSTVRSSRVLLFAFSTAGVLTGAAVTFISARGPAVYPDEATLDRVTGTVKWTRPNRYGIDFGFDGDERTFYYAHKSGDFASISAALDRASTQPLSVAIKADEPSKGLSTGYFFDVYGVSASEGDLRSYSQIRQAWTADYRYGYVAAGLAFLAAAFLAYRAATMRSPRIE